METSVPRQKAYLCNTVLYSDGEQTIPRWKPGVSAAIGRDKANGNTEQTTKQNYGSLKRRDWGAWVA